MWMLYLDHVDCNVVSSNMRLHIRNYTNAESQSWQSQCCCRSVICYCISVNVIVMPFLNILRPFRMNVKCC